MHDTAMEYGKLFFEAYLPRNAKVVDLGSQDVNGSLRSAAPADCQYVGLDFVTGKGVDVVIDDPYIFPLETGSVDAVVSSSCFEHSEFFWLSFLEALRILKPQGLFYLNVPSNGAFHRYPVDCWRFYPDSGIALQNWARRNDVDAELLESFVGQQRKDQWNDFVAVFVKDRQFADRYPNRIQDRSSTFNNGRVSGSDAFRRFDEAPQDVWAKTDARRLIRNMKQKIGIA